jgi:hypothetical protein
MQRQTRVAWLAGAPALTAYSTADGDPLELIGPLGRLTILVGANNQGKSRLLRCLFRQAHLPLLSQDTAQVYSDGIAACDALLAQIDVLFPQSFGIPVQQIPRVDFAALKLTMERRRAGERGLVEGQAVASMQALHVKMSRINHAHLVGLLEKAIQGVNAAEPERASTKKIYIPALRTAAAFRPFTGWDEGLSNEQRDTLGAVVLNRYFGATPDGGAILSGQGLYTKILHLATGPRDKRELLRAFEDFLEERFFRGAKVSISPRCSHDPSEETLHITIGDVERPLHDVGDGLGSLITLLAPFFIEDEGTWVYVEEPELYLHPGFQRIFVESILKDPRIIERRVESVVVTHSNHLVGVAVHNRQDVSILRLSSAGDETFRVTAVHPESLALLDDLGVHNSSVLLAGCSIWVEGPSDRDYVRAGLVALHRKFGENELLEDVHFAIFEYGGSNIAHYDFSRADDEEKGGDRSERIRQRWLANRVFLLADRDDASSKDERYKDWETEAEKSEGALKVRRTNGREIENELSPEVLRKALPQAFKLKAAGVDPSTRLDRAHYATVRMGGYLDQCINPGSRRFSAGESGAMKQGDKTDLARSVLELVRSAELSWEDLGEPFQGHVLAMYTFVSASNGMETRVLAEDT